LSIRHFYAELEFTHTNKAVYRFTPDSITKISWGVVEFDLTAFTYKIIRPAPVTGQEMWSEDQACLCLVSKLWKHYDSGTQSPPAVLEWVS